MAEYCSQSDLTNRLTEIGADHVFDRDQSGSGISEEEVEMYVNPPIERAGTVIDEYIGLFTETTVWRANGNKWLLHVCVDLAVVYAIENGGRKPPKSLMARHDLALKRLQAAVTRTWFPGFVQTLPSGQSTAGPRVRNVD